MLREMPAPVRPNDVFEGLLTKLLVMGHAAEGEKARADIGDFQAPYEILGVYTTRATYNPVSDFLSSTSLYERAKVVLIPTPVGGFVYVRCDWNEERRGNFIAVVLEEAVHVRVTI
jgi:hypothetical protein